MRPKRSENSDTEPANTPRFDEQHAALISISITILYLPLYFYLYGNFFPVCVLVTVGIAVLLVIAMKKVWGNSRKKEYLKAQRARTAEKSPLPSNSPFLHQDQIALLVTFSLFLLIEGSGIIFGFFSFFGVLAYGISLIAFDCVLGCYAAVSTVKSAP